MMDRPLLLVGCGKMGGAMLEGWLEMGMTAGRIHIVEPYAPVAEELRGRGLGVAADPSDLPDDLDPSVVLFAVKPQSMDDAAPAFARFRAPGTAFLSIAAGKTIAHFENILGADAAVVRSMPNTPAAVRRGITVATANAKISDDQREVCDIVLKAVGEVAWVEEEGLLDAVTALSGGGPAYVFLLAECMARAGVDAGLPADLAARLARTTVSGAGELMRLSDETPAALRENVTSPGGTTAEALRVLMAEDAWQPLMTKAIAAATARSRELAG